MTLAMKASMSRFTANGREVRRKGRRGDADARSRMRSTECDEWRAKRLTAGDPSVIVRTNVKMGDRKRPFMLAASRATAECLGKPEEYVAVMALDGMDIVFGGSDAPCALCSVVSMGSINLKNNKALSAELCELLGEFGVAGTRVYITFDDYAPENLGYDSATFAG